MQREEAHSESYLNWLRHAKSDLSIARNPTLDKNVLLETLCFHTQQTAEKAIKAVLVFLNIEFSKTHNIKSLIELLPDSVCNNVNITDAAILTDYAVTSRYPGEYEPVTKTEFKEALRLAGKVLAWAESIVEGNRPSLPFEQNTPPSNNSRGND